MDSVDSISYVDERQTVVGGAILEVTDDSVCLTVKLDLIAAPQPMIRKFQEDTLRFWQPPPIGGEEMPPHNFPLFTHAESPQVCAKRLVALYIDRRSDLTKPTHIYEIHVISFSQAHQNWMCLLTTTLDAKVHYLLTYDGDKATTRLEILTRSEDLCVSDGSIFI